MIYSGLSGLQLPLRKTDFPEAHRDSSRLTYYSTLFNSIEINSCFYKVPQTSTIARWAASVHDDFRFTFKLWKEITHNKELIFKKEDVHRFMQTIQAAENKKGSLLIQLPPSTDFHSFGMLELLLQEVSKTSGWKIAVEFRNRSWYRPEVYELLSEFHCCIVLQDIPRSATPMMDQEQEFVYVRFHGPHGNYRDSYPESFLTEYASYIKEWSDAGKTVYVYFNNTAGDAYNNLVTMNKLLWPFHQT